MHVSTESAIARLHQTGDGDTLGGRIWRARDAAKLTTKDLATKLGVRSETISSWERDRAEPRANRLFMLAGVLGVAPVWLIAGIGRGPDEEAAELPGNQLRKQLAVIKKLHAHTGEAITALEMEIGRVEQNEF